MNGIFTEFINNITLTPNQNEDVLKKYTGVCEKLYEFYYEGTCDPNKKFCLVQIRRKPMLVH